MLSTDASPSNGDVQLGPVVSKGLQTRYRLRSSDTSLCHRKALEESLRTHAGGYVLNQYLDRMVAC